MSINKGLEQYTGFFNQHITTYTSHTTTGNNTTKYYSGTQPNGIEYTDEVDAMLVAGLMTSIKTLLYSMTRREEDVYYTATGTAPRPNIINYDVENSSDVRIAEENIRTLIENYRSQLRLKISAEIEQELESVLNIKIPRSSI